MERKPHKDAASPQSHDRYCARVLEGLSSQHIVTLMVIIYYSKRYKAKPAKEEGA